MKAADIFMEDNDRSNNPILINSDKMKVHDKHLYPTNITFSCIHMYVGVKHIDVLKKEII